MLTYEREINIGKGEISNTCPTEIPKGLNKEQPVFEQMTIRISTTKDLKALISTDYIKESGWVNLIRENAMNLGEWNKLQDSE